MGISSEIGVRGVGGRRGRGEERIERRENATSGGAHGRRGLALGLRVRSLFRRNLGLELGNVEPFVDDLGHRLDLRAQFLLHGEEVEAVVVGDEVDGQTKVPEAAGATNPMEVCLGRLGKVEVDDDIHRLNVDTSGKEIWRGDRGE